MIVTFNCSWCQKQLKVNTARCKDRVLCDGCGAMVAVPIEKDPADAASPSQPESVPKTSAPSLTVTCEQCRTALKVSKKYSGRRIKCRQCGATVSVPGAKENEKGKDSPSLPTGERQRKRERKKATPFQPSTSPEYNQSANRHSKAGAGGNSGNDEAMLLDEADLLEDEETYLLDELSSLEDAPILADDPLHTRRPKTTNRRTAKRKMPQNLVAMILVSIAVVAALLLILGPGRKLLDQGLDKLHEGGRAKALAHLPPSPLLLVSVRYADLLSAPVLERYEAGKRFASAVKSRFSRGGISEEDLATLDETIIATSKLDDFKSEAVVMLCRSKSMSAREAFGQAKTTNYKGQTIYSTPIQHGIRVSSRHLVVSLSLAALQRTIDQAQSGNPPAIDLPTDAHFVVRFKLGEMMSLLQKLPSGPPAGVSTAPVPSLESTRLPSELYLTEAPEIAKTISTLEVCCRFSDKVDVRITGRTESGEAATAALEYLKRRRQEILQQADSDELPKTLSLLTHFSADGLRVENNAFSLSTSLDVQALHELEQLTTQRVLETKPLELRITGMVSPTLSRAIEKELKQLVDSGERPHIFLVRQSPDGLTFRVGPVRDLRAFAKRIAFGTITNTTTEPRVIEVALDAEWAARKGASKGEQIAIKEPPEPASGNAEEGQPPMVPDPSEVQIRADLSIPFPGKPAFGDRSGLEAAGRPPHFPGQPGGAERHRASASLDPPKDPNGCTVLFPTAMCPYVVVAGRIFSREPIEVWNLSTGKRVGQITDCSKLSDDFVAVSADGRHLASRVRFEKTVEVWSFRSGQAVWRFDPSPLDVRTLDFAGHDRLLAVDDRAKAFQLWDLGTGELKASSYTPEKFLPESLAISGNGRYLAAVSEKPPHLFIMDLASGAVKTTLTLPEPVRSAHLAFSPDSTELASLVDTGQGDELLVFAVDSGQSRKQFAYSARLEDAVQSRNYRGPALEWLPDKSGWLVYGNGILDGTNGKLLMRFEAMPLQTRRRRMFERSRLLATVQIGAEARLENVPIP